MVALYWLGVVFYNDLQIRHKEKDLSPFSLEGADWDEGVNGTALKNNHSFIAQLARHFKNLKLTND